MKVELKKFNVQAKVPKFALATDAAMDLFTYEEVTLEPGGCNQNTYRYRH